MLTFEDFDHRSIRALNESGIDYVIVGSFSCQYTGLLEQYTIWMSFWILRQIKRRWSVFWR
ncbi:MAG: hypothetical protein ACTSXX_00270 [Candidatus Baldrarchaeia archaeon]